MEEGSRAIAQTGRESAVHRDVHLDRARRDCRGNHQRDDFSHAGIVPVEVRFEMEPDTCKRRQLNEQLQ